jgi:osmotically-inducible protein OsmY
MASRHPGCTSTGVLIRLGVLVVLLAAMACARAIDATIGDAAVTAAVKTALLNDPSVDGTLVTVQTDGGVVQLGGTQPTADAAAAVVRIVRGVEGVRDVESKIEVSPQPASVTTTR